MRRLRKAFRVLATSALAMLVVAAPADETDPLSSPACNQALEELQDAQAAARREDAAAQRRVAALRQQAARICLGLQVAPYRPSPAIQEPIAVPPPFIDPPPAPRTATAPAMPAPPVEIERPRVITSCDPNGCWVDDGSRLSRTGPGWVGPTGPCSVQGAVVHCP